MTEVTKERSLTTAQIAAAAERGVPLENPTPPMTARGCEEAPRPAPSAEPPVPLFAGEEAQGFRTAWNEIQIAFVDEPRRSVEKADGLVARMIQRLAEVFAEERGRLEEEWARGEDISTEDLRLALQRYRSFFDRLLSV